MVRHSITWSLKFRYLVFVAAIALMGFGIVQLRNMPVDILPEFSPPYVEIQTEALGLSAEEVEQLITLGMEQDLLNGVPWLRTIRSESVAGLSSVVLVFEPGTDLTRARQMVSERLAQAFALPHVSKPPTMLQPRSATSRVMIVGLSSKTLSLIQMSVLARWTIGPRLMGVPGVSNVAIWGQRDRQLQVQVDPKQLLDKKVSLLQVLETTGNALWVSSLSFVEASTPGTGGFIDTSNQRLSIRHILPIVSPEGLSQVPIEDTSLKLGDVAKIVEDHQPLIGDALTTDGSSLMLVIEKFPGANTVEVSKGIEEAINQMRPGLSGMELDSSVFRPADFIQTAINNLLIALLLCGAIIIVVLAAFLLNWRSALVSFITIPLSLLAGALVLYLSGATLNVMVIAGFVIALGVLIDDAVVDVENVIRRLRQHRLAVNTAPNDSHPTIASIILAASTEMRGSVLYAAVILLLAVSPILFLDGLAGTFFKPLAIAYGLAVLIATLVALLVTPGLSLILLANAPVATEEPKLVRWLRARYETMLTRTIQKPRLVFAGMAILAVVGLASVPFLTQSLPINFKERNLLIHLNAMPGTSQPEMSRIAGRVGTELRSIPGVHNVGAHVGRAVMGDQVVNVSSAEIWISIDPAANYDKTAAAIQDVIDGYPGLTHDVQTYMKEKSSEVVVEPENALVVRIFGDSAAVLASKSAEVKQSLSGIAGIDNMHVQQPVQQPALEIEVDLTAAQKYGLKPGDVRRTAATLLSGIQVGSLFEDQKVFDVVVWSAPEIRHSLSSIRDLQIDTPNGQHVRLGDVAQVRIVPSASIIRHDAVKRYIDINVDVKGRTLAAVATDISNHLKQFPLPLEYHAEVLNDYATQGAGRIRVFAVTLAALVGIFFVLQAVYGSWRLATLSFLTTIVALAGGLLAIFISGRVISVGSLVGFLALFGIATRNQILLINHYRQLIRHEAEPFGQSLVLRGTSERLSPILMTTSATALSLILVLIMGDIPGLEVVRPMAIVLLGGLITSALVNLLGLPVLFLNLGVSSVKELDLPPSVETTDDLFGSSLPLSGMAAGK